MEQKIPVQKNYDYQIKIDRLGINGEGVGRIDNYTVFVEGALPSEDVEIKIIKVNKNYGIGKLLRVIQESPERVKPECPYFARCGGCQLQHFDYKAQLAYKTQLVKDNIERIAKLDDIIVYPAIGMDNPWQYRNKAQFPVGIIRDKMALGFYAKRSHDIVDMTTCKIQHSFNDRVLDGVRRFVNEYNFPIYNENTSKGFLRHIVTKIAFSTNEVMIIIVTNETKFPHAKEFIQLIKEYIPEVTSIIQNVNSTSGNVILGPTNITLWGKDYIIDTIGSLKFKISPLSFFQVNPVQTEKLYGKVIEYAGLKGNETALDLYCGIGTISLFLAQKVRKVIGIEIVEQAVKDARENARINNLDNIEFLSGEAERIMPELMENGAAPDVIVVDPPRKGCDEILLRSIIKSRVEKIIYVSCNPATLARDLAILSEAGYQPQKIQPVDMFPYTSHVETVTLIERK